MSGYESEAFIPDYRPDAWNGPEGRALRDTMIDNGFGETVRAVDALQDVDASALARVALTVYGTSDKFDADDVADRPDIAHEDIGSARAELYDIARELNIDFDRTVAHEWEGDAFDAYSTFKREMARATRDEADRLAEIGDELLNLARTVQRTQQDQEMTAWSNGSMLVTGAGMVSINAAALSLSAVGSFLALSKLLVDENERGKARIEFTTEYAVELEKPKLVRIERANLDLPDIDDAEDWEVQ